MDFYIVLFTCFCFHFASRNVGFPVQVYKEENESINEIKEHEKRLRDLYGHFIGPNAKIYGGNVKTKDGAHRYKFNFNHYKLTCNQLFVF